MATNSGLTKPQLTALLEAARRAGISPANLKPMSPWLDTSPTAKSLQVALLATDPAIAEELQREAGLNAPLSLLAEAYLQGVEGVQLSKELRQELQIRRPQSYGEIRAKELAAQTERFEEQMAAQSEARVAMQQQLAAQQQGAYIESLNRIRTKAQGR
jgi:hypothetical protein